MVDLVKARRKAKERKEDQERKTAEPIAAEPPASDQLPENVQPAGSAFGAATPSPPPTDPGKLDRFIRQLGTRREDESGGAGETASEEGEIFELLLFAMENEQYALPIEHVVQIIQPRAATRVPNASPEVLGVISLRGTIVSVLDVRRKLGHPPQAGLDPESRLIVVDNRGETAGFLVDHVFRVVKIEAGRLERHPVVTASEQSELIRGVFQHRGKLAILLDLDRLLDY